MHWVVVVCLLLAHASHSSCDDEFEGTHLLTLEHSFDNTLDPVFSVRGKISIISLKSGSGSYEDDGDHVDVEKLKVKYLVKVSFNGTLQALSRNDGMYRIRIPIKSKDGVLKYVSASIPACSLLESRLADVITVHVTQQGSVTGVSLQALSPLCRGVKVADRSLASFNTSVNVRAVVIGPAPETQSYIEKIEAEARAKEMGGEHDNRSFFAKYWMYLVPLVILLMTMSKAEEGGGGGGR